MILLLIVIVFCYMTAAELRETVNLVTKSSDNMVRDFVSLRTSCVHQWHTLQSELQQRAAPLGIVEGGSASSSPQKQQPQEVVSHSIPTASLTALLQQIETMLSSLINREKGAVTKLSRQLEEEKARRVQSEAKHSDLQARIDNLDQQLSSTQSNKHSSEQRNSAEVGNILH